jgi:hypothetical protein
LNEDASVPPHWSLGKQNGGDVARDGTAVSVPAVGLFTPANARLAALNVVLSMVGSN